jgi:hypothetical protein
MRDCSSACRFRFRFRLLRSTATQIFPTLTQGWSLNFDGTQNSVCCGFKLILFRYFDFRSFSRSVHFLVRPVDAVPWPFTDSRTCAAVNCGNCYVNRCSVGRQPCVECLFRQYVDRCLSYSETCLLTENTETLHGADSSRTGLHWPGPGPGPGNSH